MAEDYRYRGRFELGHGSGKYVYVQTEKYKDFGRKLISKVRAKWTPPPYFFHLAKGGHVEAARLHIDSSYFAHLDLKKFFNSCRRSRVVRALKSIGFKQRQALEYSSDSLVRLGGERVIPYGFSQSPILASICLHHSALGNALASLHEEGEKVSVYVDDIVVSGDAEAEVEDLVDRLIKSAEQARFALAHDKVTGTQPEITPFNLVLANDKLELSAKQYAEFKARVAEDPSSAVALGTIRYAEFVNPSQAETL